MLRVTLGWPGEMLELLLMSLVGRCLWPKTLLVRGSLPSNWRRDRRWATQWRDLLHYYPHDGNYTTSGAFLPSSRYVAMTSSYFWFCSESVISSLGKPIVTMSSVGRQRATFITETVHQDSKKKKLLMGETNTHLSWMNHWSPPQARCKALAPPLRDPHSSNGLSWFADEKNNNNTISRRGCEQQTWHPHLIMCN